MWGRSAGQGGTKNLAFYKREAKSNTTTILGGSGPVSNLLVQGCSSVQLCNKVSYKELPEGRKIIAKDSFQFIIFISSSSYLFIIFTSSCSYLCLQYWLVGVAELIRWSSLLFPTTLLCTGRANIKEICKFGHIFFLFFYFYFSFFIFALLAFILLLLFPQPIALHREENSSQIL